MASPKSNHCRPISKRRVPGPAGHLYWNANNEKQKQEHEEKQEEERPSFNIGNNIFSNRSTPNNKISLTSPDLWRGPFITGCFENNIEITEERGTLYLIKNDKSSIFKDNLASIQCNKIERVFKVAELMVLLKKLTVFDDAFGVAVDPFGTIKATLTHKVLRDFIDIRAGSCLILENVTIYQPSHYDFYLNIVTNNISRVYPNHTPIPCNLKPIFKKFQKKMGIKSQSQKNETNDILKPQKKDIMKDKQALYDNKMKQTKKKRYSEMMERPWLVTHGIEDKHGLNKKKILQNKIEDDDDDENTPIMSVYNTPNNKNKRMNSRNKSGTDKDDEEDTPIIIIRNEENGNESEESEDMVILSSNNKKNNDLDGSDDDIIKELDMNETPKGPKKVNMIRSEGMEMVKEKKSPFKPRRFSFKNKTKDRCPDKKDENEDKSKDTSPSRWSEHYDGNRNSGVKSDRMNMFENAKSVKIPKEVDLLNGLFSQMEDGFVFPND